MASLHPLQVSGKQPHSFRPSLRIDMSPLVDLGFLLITFFVFTSSLKSNAVMPLVVPAEGPPMTAGESATLTVLLGRNNEVVAYSGFWKDAVTNNSFSTTNYHVLTGIGSLIREKQQQLVAAGKHKKDLILLVKPTAEASYKNVVDMLDEATINSVERYALVSPEAEETIFMEQRAGD